MDNINELELFDCPVCQGSGLIEEENGWCVYASCLDCGTHTAEVPFNNEEEKLEAIRRVTNLWNIGKVISGANGE
ncbi:MAG: hypothetical protein E7456_06935 [Ruminococcaceae bacterium]|nr:hypothetical protein [Oscillospiraceae bacterium]